MQQWEYYTTILSSDWGDEVGRQYMQSRYPDWTSPPMYAVESLARRLDELGRAGWELVSMRPVVVGMNGDILVQSPFREYSARYFCAFKRPIVQDTAE